MNDSRSQILRMVRLALATPTHLSHSVPPGAQLNIRNLFASSAEPGSLVDRFRKEFERVSGEIILSSDAFAAVDAILRFIEKEGVGSVVISHHEICHRLSLLEQLSAALPQVKFLTENINSEDSFQRARLKDQMSRVPLSITGIDYLIADIGTMVTIAHPQASRQISLLPQIHMVLATPDQIRLNMAELFEEIRAQHGERLPGSAITLITGPSRSADIEKVLIKGVHGPTRLVAVLIDRLE